MARLLVAAAVLLSAASAHAQPGVDRSKAEAFNLLMVDDQFVPDHLSFRHGVPYRLHLENRGKDLHESALRPVGSATQQPGTGFGLGFAVLMDAAQAQVLGTPGEYYWSGAAATHFFVSPEDDLFAIFMTQLMGATGAPFGRELRTSVYQALTD